MVRYKVRTFFPFAAIASILSVVACGDIEVSTTTPTVTTSPIGSISSTSASAGGEVTDDGGASMIVRGVCWNTGGEPTIDDDCTLNGSGVGEFESTLRGLVENTGYHVRAYASNSQGVAYGGDVQFHTDTPPSETPSLATVITIAVFSITDNSALVDAEVVSDGDAAVESRGVCWSTSQEPDLDDECIAQGDGVGVYTSSIVGLEADTQYFVRAYAINEVGSAYGGQRIFTTTIEEPESCGSVTDIDGHTYDGVQIAEQCWMVENLRTTRYRDGTTIPNVTGDADWGDQTTGAWANFDNDSNNDAIYGKMYNGYAAIDSRGLCPTGWSVATDNDWKQLELELGMPASEVDGTGHRGGVANEGGRLKEVGTNHWFEPNEGATNGTGFSAYPGGDRNPGPTEAGFWSIGRSAYFWTATEAGESVWIRGLSYTQRTVFRAAYAKNWGFSVRCVEN